MQSTYRKLSNINARFRFEPNLFWGNMTDTCYFNLYDDIFKDKFISKRKKYDNLHNRKKIKYFIISF